MPLTRTELLDPPKSTWHCCANRPHLTNCKNAGKQTPGNVSSYGAAKAMVPKYKKQPSAIGGCSQSKKLKTHADVQSTPFDMFTCKRADCGANVVFCVGWVKFKHGRPGPSLLMVFITTFIKLLFIPLFPLAARRRIVRVPAI